MKRIQEIQDENSVIKDLSNNMKVENERIKCESIETKNLIKNLEIKVKLTELKMQSELGILVWKIDEISDKRKDNKRLSSDYFYSPSGHKMILYFYPNGSRTNLSSQEISFKLYMSSFQCNNLVFFNGDVIIEIFDQNTGQVSHRISKRCEIRKGRGSCSFEFNCHNYENSIICRCLLPRTLNL